MVINLSSILYILFELTIFVILSIQLYQLGTQFLLPALRKQIGALGKFWIDLQSQIELLTATKKRLEKKTKEQEKTLETLEQKVKRWHEQLQKKQTIREQAQNDFVIILAAQKKAQYERLCTIKKEKELFPQALVQAKEKLQQICAGPEGKQLLQRVLKNVTKAPTKSVD